VDKDLWTKISFIKIFVDDMNVIAEIRPFIRLYGRVIEEVSERERERERKRKREKRHVWWNLIDNGLRIAFGWIGSYDRTVVRQSFSELSNPLNFDCRFDCKTYRIEPAQHDTKSHPYI